MARAALRQQDWNLVRTIILSMSEEERAEPTWTYWMGRARKAQGQPRDAGKLFASLTARHDFYGKLANEELGRPPVIPRAPGARRIRPASPPSTPTRASRARWLSTRWACASKATANGTSSCAGRPESELRAAAHWAMQRKLLDRAINTDERIRSDADFTLRFPTPFAEQLVPIARGRISMRPGSTG